MALAIEQQAKQLIEKSDKVLLVAHTKMDGDTLSATIAMHLLLKKMGKQTVVTCADAVPEEFSFLPETEVMRREISSGSDFVISLDCSLTHAQKLRWKIEDEHLKIFITPSGGQFKKSDVSFFEQSDFDLIICLDAADKKQLGAIFEENTELFARVPLIVFDHHASNPGFGTVNLIDTKAASTTEVLFHFVKTLFGAAWEKKIDPDVATLLLTGIITDTGSFQNPNTTPRSLEVAADLVEMGARQQEIIRNIFKTKNIQTLKLWGRVLSKIKTDPIHRMLWSTVSADDLADTGGSIEETGGIIDELLATAPGMEMVLLLKERSDGMITASVRTTTALCDAAEFAAEFGGGGHTQAAGFKIRGKKAFDIVVGEVVSAAQTFQAKRLKFPGSNQTAKENEQVDLPQKNSSMTSPIELEQPTEKSGKSVDVEMPLPVEIVKKSNADSPTTPENNDKADAVETHNKTAAEPSITVSSEQADEAEQEPRPEKKQQEFTPEDFSEMLERMMKQGPLNKMEEASNTKKKASDAKSSTDKA
jgi:phosphoesterase RecJ-like protein